MGPKKARVLVTKKCNRDCPGCCNKYPSLANQMQPADIQDLYKYDDIMITGGEPMLDPDRTKDIIIHIRHCRMAKGYKRQRIYLYTALYSPKMRSLFPYIDGVHYTIHDNPSAKDMRDFEKAQKDLEDFTGTARLYIDNRVDKEVKIKPSTWLRVEVKPWQGEGECPLPEDALLVLNDG